MSAQAYLTSAKLIMTVHFWVYYFIFLYTIRSINIFSYRLFANETSSAAALGSGSAAAAEDRAAAAGAIAEALIACSSSIRVLASALPRIKLNKCVLACKVKEVVVSIELTELFSINIRVKK